MSGSYMSMWGKQNIEKLMIIKAVASRESKTHNRQWKTRHISVCECLIVILDAPLQQRMLPSASSDDISVILLWMGLRTLLLLCLAPNNLTTPPGLQAFYVQWDLDHDENADSRNRLSTGKIIRKSTATYCSKHCWLFVELVLQHWAAVTVSTKGFPVKGHPCCSKHWSIPVRCAGLQKNSLFGCRVRSNEKHKQKLLTACLLWLVKLTTGVQHPRHKKGSEQNFFYYAVRVNWRKSGTETFLMHFLCSLCRD